MGKYKKLERIGKGTYGKVYKAVNTETGQIVAIKKIILKKPEDGYPATALREITLLSRIDHPCVIQVKEVLAEPNRLNIVFEHLECDLYHLIQNQGGKLPAPLVKCYLKQILAGLAEIHSKRIIHRDIKPSNILVTGETLKIADFGLGRTQAEPIRPYTPVVTTILYRAPEVILFNGNYSYEVDIWSVGCVFFEMVTGQILFKGDCDLDHMNKIFARLGTPPLEGFPLLKQARYDFPNFPQQSVYDAFPFLDLDDMGYDLLDVSLL